MKEEDDDMSIGFSVREDEDGAEDMAVKSTETEEVWNGMDMDMD